MRRKSLWLTLSLLLVFSMLIAACGGAATPIPTTEAPAATVAAAVTAAPAATEAAAATTEAPATEAAAATTEAAAMTEAAAATTEAPAVASNMPKLTKLVFGLLMVGPYNDHGWSQATYEGAQYAQSKIPGSELIYLDKVNSADRPGTTESQLAEELLGKGANVIIFNSDAMQAEAIKFAKAHPDIYTVHLSGDSAWKDGKNYDPIPNLTDIMGRMEYGKEMAGCAAAFTTQTGKIGYLGPLINDETRRLASSVFLGAKYCWTNYLKKDPAQLSFKVTWIGFWFNIPGVTSDPTQVADDFINNGYDVVISGIDTTEALTEAKKFAGAGKKVWAIPYDYVGGCEEATEVCLGVPYFNWGPAMLKNLNTVLDGSWQAHWEWNPPDWSNINNKDTSAVGFEKGAALTSDASAKVDQFIKELADGLNLWTGPINLQDGTPYLKEGEVATDQQVWYLPQLLQGMEGQSVSQ